jgi:hypothetical protein
MFLFLFGTFFARAVSVEEQLAAVKAQKNEAIFSWNTSLINR